MELSRRGFGHVALNLVLSLTVFFVLVWLLLPLPLPFPLLLPLPLPLPIAVVDCRWRLHQLGFCSDFRKRSASLASRLAGNSWEWQLLGTAMVWESVASGKTSRFHETKT